MWVLGFESMSFARAKSVLNLQDISLALKFLSRLPFPCLWSQLGYMLASRTISGKKVLESAGSDGLPPPSPSFQISQAGRKEKWCLDRRTRTLATGLFHEPFHGEAE